jgi:hypothetical protein
MKETASSAKGRLLIVGILAIGLVGLAFVAVYSMRTSRHSQPEPESKTGSRSTFAFNSSASNMEQDNGDRRNQESAQSGTQQTSEDDAGVRLHSVDLEALRVKMPNNLYWRMDAPTKDPKETQERDEEKRRWNVLYGKVLSNTATEEEIQKYYDHRQKISEDYIQFAGLVLDDYGDKISDKEHGLYELSIRMHKGRLREIPRQREEALARKRVQDARREEWKRSQKTQ